MRAIAKIMFCYGRKRGSRTETFDSLRNSNNLMRKNICNSHYKTAKNYMVYSNVNFLPTLDIVP